MIRKGLPTQICNLVNPFFQHISNFQIFKYIYKKQISQITKFNPLVHTINYNFASLEIMKFYAQNGKIFKKLQTFYIIQFSIVLQDLVFSFKHQFSKANSIKHLCEIKIQTGYLATNGDLKHFGRLHKKHHSFLHFYNIKIE